MMQKLPDLSSSPSDETLARFLSNELSLTEHQYVQRWIAACPKRREMLELMSDVWTDPVRTLDDWDRNRLYAAFDARLHAPGQALQKGAATDYVGAPVSRETVRRETFRSVKAQPVSTWWRGIALTAATVAIAVSGMWGWRSLRPAPVRQVATTDWKYNTGAGQRATVQLADGSSVTLGPSSRLAPAEGFGQSSRAVSLEGEAYFDVASNAALPFVVKTGEAEARVLGTEFNIRRYIGDTLTKIAVAKGRVAIDASGTTTMLSAGDLTEIPPNGRAMVRHDSAAVRAAIAWRSGWLTMVNLPVIEATQELERWYDIDVRVTDDSIARRKITVSFRDADMNTVIHQIADALDARVVRVGRTVTFSTR